MKTEKVSLRKAIEGEKFGSFRAGDFTNTFVIGKHDSLALYPKGKMNPKTKKTIKRIIIGFVALALIVSPLAIHVLYEKNQDLKEENQELSKKVANYGKNIENILAQIKTDGKVIQLIINYEDEAEWKERANQRYVEGFDDGLNHTVELKDGKIVSYCEFVNFYAEGAKYELKLK